MKHSSIIKLFIIIALLSLTSCTKDNYNDSTNENEIEKKEEDYDDLDTSEEIKHEINYDTLYFTLDEKTMVYGENFGKFKKERYNIYINDIKIPDSYISTWTDTQIYFWVPKNIDVNGYIQINKGEVKGDKIPYLSGDYTCFDVHNGDVANYNVLKLYNIDYFPECIWNLRNLRVLLGANMLVTQIPKEIGNLHNLNILAITNSKLEEVPSNISYLKKLETLNLIYNDLTSLPESIKTLNSNLLSLHLVGNNFSEQEKTKIRNWLPNTNISF